MVVKGRDACTGFAAVQEGSECWLNLKLFNCHSVLC